MPKEQTGSKLVLVIGEDTETRRSIRPLLATRGYDVVYAVSGFAALELIQRMPESFRLVLMELELRALPASAVIETLRLFRPDLPVLCMSARRGAAVPAGCLQQPLVPAELDAQLGAVEQELAGGQWAAEGPLFTWDDQAVARAKARYALGGDLVEAAMELARGLPSES